LREACVRHFYGTCFPFASLSLFDLSLFDLTRLFFYFCKIVVARSLCKDRNHLESAAHEIIADGGEGVILQRVGSIYKQGRTPSLLKLKVKQKEHKKKKHKQKRSTKKVNKKIP
jgi:hypothetical protein